MKRLLLPLLILAGCAAGGRDSAKPDPLPEDPERLQEAADGFLEDYSAEFQALYAEWYEGEWAANTYIVEGDDSRVEAAEAARKAYAEFTGSAENILAAQEFLGRGEELEPLQVLQFERMLHLAAANPQTVPEQTAELIAFEGAHVQDLFGYEFLIDGEPVTPNEIDRILRESDDLAEREKAWEASKEVGAALKPGLAHLRDLRNSVVGAMDHPDYYSYQVSEYGMTAEEMNALMLQLNRELRPLYRELHTWARYELAERYGEPVPDLLPAHWLPNRWAQDWSALVEVEGVDLSAALEGKSPAQMIRMGEDFYVSMGFEELPASFWEKSSIEPVAADAPYKKNSHASAWHMDLDQDVRTLMSIEPNAEWYETVHHELGHIYYFLEYANPQVPLLLRQGANRAYHEAVGSQMGLAAMQYPFMKARGLVDAEGQPDEIQLLLREALNNVVFMSFGAGTMPMFEYELYAEELPADEFNAAWWRLAERFQGIAPPTPRGEEHADGLSKTHIHNDAAQYYDYALSYVILYQLHAQIAEDVLGQDPRATNYYGSREAGAFLQEILSVGMTRDWQELLVETTGRELTAEPMLEYYAPLLVWLREQNRGRTYTLAEL